MDVVSVSVFRRSNMFCCCRGQRSRARVDGKGGADAPHYKKGVEERRKKKPAPSAEERQKMKNNLTDNLSGLGLMPEKM